MFGKKRKAGNITSGGYLKFMRETWTKIPPDQIDEACAHVETYDFPESRSTLTEMAQAAGLSHSRLISQYVQHHTLLFVGDKLKTTEE